MTDNVHCHLNKSQPLVNTLGKANHVHTCSPLVVRFILILPYHLRILGYSNCSEPEAWLSSGLSAASQCLTPTAGRPTVCPQLASVCSFFWRLALVGFRQLAVNLQCWHQTSRVNLWAPRFLYIGQTFRYSPENAFYIFNQQIYFIIWYLLDRASLT